MTRSFFEIGGEIIELENDYRFMTGQRTAKEHKSRKSMIKPVTKLADHMVKTGSESIEAANENKFGFEEAGTLVGIWFGLIVAAATLPVTVVDGPLAIYGCCLGSRKRKIYLQSISSRWPNRRKNRRNIGLN